MGGKNGKGEPTIGQQYFCRNLKKKNFFFGGGGDEIRRNIPYMCLTITRSQMKKYNCNGTA
jgi:hypothetical protein